MRSWACRWASTPSTAHAPGSVVARSPGTLARPAISAPKTSRSCARKWASTPASIWRRGSNARGWPNRSSAIPCRESSCAPARWSAFGTDCKENFTKEHHRADSFHSAAPCGVREMIIVVPFAAGSGTDQLARSLAQALGAQYKVPVIVDNRAGASGFLAAQYVAKAVPDGYTVLMTTNTTHAANEHLFKKLPYDPVKDFTPVALLSKGHMLLLVNADSAIKSVADLIAAAKKSPGKLNFGSGSSSSRVASESLKQMAGIDVVNVPYKSNPMAITDLLGGQVDFMFADTPTALPQVKSGKLRALAVSGNQRLAAVPALPTVEEAGVKGYDMSYWTAVYLPPGGPAAITGKLNEMVIDAASAPPFVAYRASTSGEVVTSTPEGLAAFQAAESRKWGQVLRAAGIQPERRMHGGQARQNAWARADSAVVITGMKPGGRQSMPAWQVGAAHARTSAPESPLQYRPRATASSVASRIRCRRLRAAIGAQRKAHRAAHTERIGKRCNAAMRFDGQRRPTDDPGRDPNRPLS